MIELIKNVVPEQRNVIKISSASLFSSTQVSLRSLKRCTQTLMQNHSLSEFKRSLFLNGILESTYPAMSRLCNYKGNISIRSKQPTRNKQMGLSVMKQYKKYTPPIYYYSIMKLLSCMCEWVCPHCMLDLYYFLDRLIIIITSMVLKNYTCHYIYACMHICQGIRCS